MIKTNGEFTSNSTVLQGLEVASITEDNKEWSPLPRTFIRPDIPVDNDEIIKPSQHRKWKYLENVMNQLTFSDDISVALLLEPTAQRQQNQLKSSKSRNGGPYLEFDLVGVWFSLVNKTKTSKVLCNQIAVNQADTKEVGRQLFQAKKEVKKNAVPDMLQQMHHHKFKECQHLVNKDVADMFQEELKFIEILKNGWWTLSSPTTI